MLKTPQEALQELDAALDKYAATLTKAHRSQRHTTLWLGATIGALSAFYLGLVWLGGGVWVWRDTFFVIGLGACGLSASWACWLTVKWATEADDRYIEAQRKLTHAEIQLAGVAPLLAAIRTAHDQGESLVVAPPQEQDAIDPSTWEGKPN